ncbi:L-threonylcarbamoyladenylate synthase [Pararhizobium arenae]|uniref:L-threonylcarbamoyladenylate synthase n=1 Tax=Pararhizobium arenae TaxID=1856850 RepID=UPI00094AE79E|nr:L-threonylcarbamoyladenylate synthase [Pararhizobium arenae]
MLLDTRNDEAAALRASLEALSEGLAIGIPTETVYGLAADATNPEAVARIYDLKRRPSFNPLICHCCDIEMVGDYACLDPLSEQLATVFWPGPLTLVLHSNPVNRLPSITTAGLDTVAVRVPVGFSNRLINSFGRPLAAPSANLSGRVSATTAQHVAGYFGSELPVVVDGGPTVLGLESTILRVVEGSIELLRPGAVSLEEVESAVGMAVTIPEHSPAIIAPGMLSSHYAPRTPVRLEATEVRGDEVLLTFGQRSVRGSETCVRVFNLSPGGDLAEFAAALYRILDEADRLSASGIAIVPVPASGIGLAINDRLRRAAAPRS